LFSSIYGLKLTSEFVTLPQISKVIENLETLKSLFPVEFKTMVMAELLTEKTLIPFTLSFDENNHWEISVNKVDIPKPEIKRKWWKFISPNKQTNGQ
jgi:hypothetical protein